MAKPNTKSHQEIGRELDLFSVHDVAPGAIFWHHKGYIIYKTLVDFLRKRLLSEGYKEINTPVMVKSDLFKKSGHWDFYHEHMFTLEVDGESYSLKPMNCPEACLVYSTRLRSYQDLPLRLADFGVLHRNELSGVLGGAFRVRQFSIDDAHHFVRPDQIEDEVHGLILLVVEFYKSLGFIPEFFLSTKPDKAMGDPKLWEEAEKDLNQALDNAKVKYGMKEKDGDWQLATIQLDFQIPEKMQLEYIDKDGKAKRPVIVHRAILGSVERFIGILTEHYQGAFPIWLSPVQVVLLPIADRHTEHAKKIAEKLSEEGIRVEVDDRSERLQAKIREATLQKVPFLGIIGDEELKNKDLSLSVRDRNGKDYGLLNLSQFKILVKEDIDKKV